MLREALSCNRTISRQAFCPRACSYAGRVFLVGWRVAVNDVQIGKRRRLKFVSLCGLTSCGRIMTQSTESPCNVLTENQTSGLVCMADKFLLFDAVKVAKWNH